SGEPRYKSGSSRIWVMRSRGPRTLAQGPEDPEISEPATSDGVKAKRPGAVAPRALTPSPRRWQSRLCGPRWQDIAAAYSQDGEVPTRMDWSAQRMFCAPKVKVVEASWVARPRRGITRMREERQISLGGLRAGIGPVGGGEKAGELPRRGRP